MLTIDKRAEAEERKHFDRGLDGTGRYCEEYWGLNNAGRSVRYRASYSHCWTVGSNRCRLRKIFRRKQRWHCDNIEEWAGSPSEARSTQAEC